MVKDITYRKQAEVEIQKALEKEKELNELKSRFVSMVSHDFRTPLSTILICSDLLKSFGQKFSEQKKLHALNKIQTAVKKMTLLLDDVLLIGKAESGRIKFNPAPLNLEAFCREALSEIEMTASSLYNFEFSCQGECSTVEMDEKLLRNIFINLLSNSVKYSPQGGTVQLHLVCENERAVFQIKDSGIGIPATDKERLFEVFHRGRGEGNGRKF